MDSLTPSQAHAYEILQSPNNVFLTGVAGTGKSYLLRRFMRELDLKTFPVLASTGAAAVLIGGRTFHSFFGLGILEGGAAQTITRALEDQRLRARLRRIEGFILDEVSMISGETLSVAETIARMSRDESLPWGGLKVVVVGDFAQLPPVSRQSRFKDWAFLSDTWQRSNFTPVVLTDIVRTDDAEFVSVLNDVRAGIISETVVQFLDQRVVTEFDDQYNGTCLFAHRQTTDQYNEKKLNDIDDELFTFPTQYFGGQERQLEMLRKSAPIPEQLLLKRDAYVMTRINDPRYRFINGTTGRIVDIQPEKITIQLKSKKEIEIEPVEFSLLDAEGKVTAVARNFPLTLAYATTIHKSQGVTLDDVFVDLSRLWEPGQAYVAMSRLRKGSGLKISSWNRNSIKADDAVKRFHEQCLS